MRQAVERLRPEARGLDDHLIAAIVDKLPATDKPFPAEARVAWLKLMAMSFDVAYGALEELPATDLLRAATIFGGPAGGAMLAASEAAGGPAKSPPPKHAGYDYHVALDGTVCDANGNAVLISDVPAEEQIFDYRPVTGDFRDLDSLTWSDGSRGTAGLAAGVSFCGPG